MIIINLSESPIVLQEAVAQKMEFKHKPKLIRVIAHERKWPADNSIIYTTYKAYLQYAYEFLIIQNRVTPDGGPLDDEVETNWINGADLFNIIESADYAKDDVIRKFKEEGLS